jgi:hypothetical protein
MDKLFFVVGIVALSGMLNVALARQSESTVSSDSTALFQYWSENLPDSVKVSVPSDSLNNIFSNCFNNRFSMPIYEPDTELTENMPQFKPPKVDEKMIVPQFKKCPDEQWPSHKKRDD